LLSRRAEYKYQQHFSRAKSPWSVVALAAASMLLILVFGVLDTLLYLMLQSKYDNYIYPKTNVANDTRFYYFNSGYFLWGDVGTCCAYFAAAYTYNAF